MEFVRLHPGFKLPTKGSESAGGYDLYMPAAGRVRQLHPSSPATYTLVGLGFAAKVPEGFVALILPRSGAGAKHGVRLRNTAGVIDSDYTGEWMVAVSQQEGGELDWSAGERLFQYVLVPAGVSEPVEVDALPETKRGDGGFGSSDTKEPAKPAAKPVKQKEAPAVAQPVVEDAQPEVKEEVAQEEQAQ